MKMGKLSFAEYTAIMMQAEVDARDAKTPAEKAAITVESIYWQGYNAGKNKKK